MHRRLLTVSGTVVALIAFAAPVVSAAQPVTTPWEVSGTVNVDGLCAFSIQVDYVATGTVTNFFDGSGLLVARERHWVEVDTFSANGKTAVGTGYHANMRWTYDSSGNILSADASGLVEKVTLPDGTVFFSAGRVDFLDDNDLAFNPDVGHSGNVAALCAAFAET